VLLRLLQYYGDMVSRKRQADRDYKRQAQHRNQEAGHALILPLNDNQDHRPQGGNCSLLQEIAAYQCTRRYGPCDCRSTAGWHAIRVESENDERLITLELGCEHCSYLRRVSMTRQELERTGRKFRPPDTGP